MAARKSYNLLPGVFQTDANKKFLSATVDQLISEPELKDINGYIGRKFAPTYKNQDSYIVEDTQNKQNYQLEPSVVVRDDIGSVNFFATYTDLLDKIRYYGGITTDHSRLFDTDYYSFDPLISFDKFVNFSQYYWLPYGPAAVNVNTSGVELTQTFEVTRTPNGYLFLSNDVTYTNLVLARGGTYQFNVDQPGVPFWIQSELGVDGLLNATPTIGSRNVLGVENNGIDTGTITFNVPQATAQDRFNKMTRVFDVEYATPFNILPYKNLHNKTRSQFLAAYPQYAGITGTLDGKHLIFVNVSEATNVGEEAWTAATVVDPNTNLPITGWGEGDVVPAEDRYGVWRVQFIDLGIDDPLIRLVHVQDVNLDEKVYVKYGIGNANKEFYKEFDGFFREVPLLTAMQDTLYIQDGSVARFYSFIKLVESAGWNIDVENDILGKKNYTSPNGVVFTSGLKIRFDTDVTPSSYQDKEYYVEQVGADSGIRLVDTELLVRPEGYNDEIALNYPLNRIVLTKEITTAIPAGTVISAGDVDVEVYAEVVVGKNYITTLASTDNIVIGDIVLGPGIPEGCFVASLRPDYVAAEYITINRASIDLNAWSRNNRWFHRDIITLTAQYNNSQLTFDQELRAQRPIIQFECDLQLFNNGRKYKKPIDILDTSTLDAFNELEGYIVNDGVITYGTSAAESSSSLVTYTTSGPGGAAISVEERVLDAAQNVYYNGEYIGTTATVRIIDESALGIPLYDGLRVLFANDQDPLVRDKIYVLNLVQYSADPFTEIPNGPKHIKLTIADDGDADIYDTVVVTKGQYRGSQWWYDGVRWLESQQKTQVQQDPLFDIFDPTGTSLSTYTRSDFIGTKIFGYDRTGIGIIDPVLGFPLKYRSFATQGDIEFANYFNSDTFTYAVDQNIITANINTGFVYQITDKNNPIQKNTWNVVPESTRQYQLISYIYDGSNSPFKIDVTPSADQLSIPYLKVFKNNSYLQQTIIDTTGTLITNWVLSDNNVTLTAAPQVGDKIDILVYSREISKLGHYEIPLNLDLNAQNVDIDSLTLGQLRNHLVELGRNSTNLIGPILGSSNLRDIEIKSQGGSILQHAAPLPYASLFLIDQTANFVNATRYAQQEYTKFKNKFLEYSSSLQGIDPRDAAGSVDLILTTINAIKNKTFPWYYSDMVPYGTLRNVINDPGYTVFDPFVRSYEITSVFNTFELSNKAVLVYLTPSTSRNDGEWPAGEQRQLTVQYNYVFETDRPAITFTSNTELQIDDLITIVEYSNTDGNYIPETPSKLGLYPRYIPAKFTDDTYREEIDVIRGHDGSLTPAFGDYRDDFLLELERRIYNNIKLPDLGTYQDIFEVIPGKFRDGLYNINEINQVLGNHFMTWVGNNKVDFATNDTFDPNDAFTWNYSKFQDTINGEPLPGSWRSCFLYFFDTVRPHLMPWEMLGFTTEPDWWQGYYGPAPYTGGNKLLWDDLEAGRIRDGARSQIDQGLGAGIDPNYIRPGLSRIIPVDDNGFLKSPAQIITAAFSSNRAGTSWGVGQYGPVEWAWRTSSDFAFATQLALAVSKPALYFGRLMDTYRYTLNVDLNQYLTASSQHHIRQTDIGVNGDETSGTVYRSAGYLNWIGDYLRNQGINPVTKIGTMLKNYSVNLAYKMSGFTDQRYLKVLAEQSSPSSTNDSILVPNENYEVYLNEQPVPITKLTYSAVIIEKTNSGWSVRGYDLNSSYFTIIPSVVNNNAYKIKVLNSEGVVFRDYQPIKLTVPYGFEFISQQQVVDFLISYERYLLAQGFTFNETDDMLNETRNWRLSVKEFLFWAQQGWKEGSILVLSPVANSLSAISVNAITAGIEDSQYGSKVLDQNFALVKNNNYSVLRTPTNFNVTLTDSASVIGYVEVNLVQFEHALIFDNATVFNDIIYKPELGNRQYRLKLIGQKTAAWDGSLSAPGFVYNSATIQPWVLGVDYLKGDLVTYKNKYYVALQNIVANTQFEFQYWKQIATTEIKTGLLPNFSSIAVKSQSSYDAYGYFEDIEQQKYSHGLIGFKPRQYLDDIGLNETTQIEFYKGYIKQKGTNNAVDALKKTTFNNLSSDINYYEEWAVRIGEYGALDNNPYVEIALDEKTYSVNPAIAQFVNDSQKNLADGLSIFNSSQLHKSTSQFNGNIALNRNAQSDYDSDIPTAGYVNIDDVDTTIFDLANYVDLDGKIADMGSGYTIWCAKDFSQQWNVYRVTETNNYITSVTNSLDGFVTFTSETPHGFLVNDVFLIKGFAAEFDGFYQVVKKEDNNNIMVKFNGGEDVLATLTTQTGRGILYTLDSMRFAFMEDSRVYGQPLNGWKVGDKIWIDRDAETTEVQGQPYSPTNTWKVYEKQKPWTLKQPLNRSASENSSLDGFGTSARTSADGYITVVGAPYLGNGTVYTFFKDLNENFSESFRVTSVAANTRAFGYSVDLGSDIESNSTLAVGAPQSYGNVGYVHVYTKAINSVTYERSQILVGNVLVPGENFGTSLTFNQDATWLYIGAPGNATVNADTVYAYGLNKFIPEERQITSVNNENYIKLTGTITAANGDILTQPLTGARILVDGTFTATSNIKVNSLTNIVNDSSLANVALSGNIRANVGDFVTQTTSGANIFIYSAQADVNSVYGSYVNAFTFDTTGNIEINGVVQVVATNSGNANVATWSNVGIKPTSVGSGNIFLNGVDTGLYPDETFTRSVTNRIEITGWIPAVTNDANSILVTSGSQTFIPNIDYVLDGANVKFIVNGNVSLSSNIAQDDYTIIQQPYFALVTTIKVPSANAGSRFGEALSSSFDGAQLAVGAPNDTVLGLPGAGSVWVYDRVIEAFNSTGSTTYTTKGNIDAVHRVTIDEIEVTNYDVTGTNTIEFIEPPPVGKLVFVETNAFILLEKLIGVDSLEGGTGAIQANAAFGTSLTICSNNCAIYIGAPFYDNGSKYNTGAVWKFHNKGRLYGTNFGFLDNPTFTVGDTIRLDNFEITVANVNTPLSTVASLDDVVENINSANLLGISAVNENNRLRLNTDKTVAKNLLRILSGTNSPGSDGVYAAAGLIVFAFMQIIINPFNAEGEYFGNKVKLAANAYALVIGSKRGTTRRFATFDADGTTFDDATTRWFDGITGSGSVYFYELYDDPRDAVEKPGRYAYAQQLDTGDLAAGDEFGAAVDIEGGYVTVTSPGREYTDADGNVIVDAGTVYIFENPNRTRGWKLIRYQQPKVDIDTVNRMYLYNSLTNTIVSNLEFIDPAKGKILGLAEQEISFKTEYDPAVYNRGTNPEVIVNSSLYWNRNQVGKVWWNLSKIRFVDYEQDSLTYRSINWGRLFPGSSVEICEWVESTVLPSQYVANGGDGIPKYADDSAYVELTYVDAITNIITSKFYYWVLDKTTVDPNDETRVLPIKSIQDYIANPKGQGISYAAIIRNDAIIVYNVSEYLSAKNTILHLDYELSKNINIIHSEYELIQRGNPDNYIPEKITNKLIDSLSGITEEGKVVPDPKLSVADRYGISFRPRQSMFVDRLSAINELVAYVNGVLIDSPVAKEFDLSQLLAEEPAPSKKLNEYDESVNTRQELDYLDTTPLDEGYLVLVLNDETQDNLWVLYTLTADKEWQINRVQSYKTSSYWTYTDWYGLKADGETRYSAGDKITYSVETLVDALKLSYAPGDIIRINNTGNGKWQQVLVNDNYGFDTIGIQDGTVQLNNSLGNFADNGLGFGNQGYSTNRYDQNPNIEIRNIINSLKDDIFISTLQGEFNKTFFVIVNYLFEEQKYVDWIFKTSFISVTHNLRPLNQYPNYVKDNQSYYLDYINEVKPYRTKTREYLINYKGDDVFGGDITDFDLPPYYDADLRIFRSPSGELVEKDQATWQTNGYTQWYANRNPKLFSIIVESGGSGYVAEPTITIVGGNAITQATARAVIDFDTGAVTDIYVITYGSGYTTTPTVIINGSCDTPAVAYAVLSNQQVRSFDTTLKFDRISYGTTVQQWAPNTFFLANTIVSYGGQGYITPANITTGSTFISSDFEIYAANLFTNANDRIMAYYDPSTGMPAKDLNQLLYGIEYPGVQVQGVSFNQTPGFSGSAVLQIVLNSAVTVYAGNVITQTYNVNLGSDATPNVQPVTASITITNTAVSATRIYGTMDTTADFTLGNVISIDGSASSAYPLQANLYVPSTAGASFDFGLFDNVEYNEDGSPILSEDFLDTVIRGAYTDSSLGLRPEDIDVDGGAYVDRYSSHAPEELIPGIIYDTLDMKVYTKINANVDVIGYRIFNRSFQTWGNAAVGTSINETSYLRIADAYSTTLAQELALTDTEIYLTDASMLPVPGVATATPGVVFIGAERIVYWTIDYTANTLGQLRRGTNGTGAKSIYGAGTIVVDGSLQQRVPNTVFANVNLAPAGANVIIGNINVWFNDGNHVTTTVDGTGLNGSTTEAALFLKAGTAGVVVASTIPDALVTEDTINTISTEDGTDIFEEDQE